MDIPQMNYGLVLVLVNSSDNGFNIHMNSMTFSSIVLNEMFMKTVSDLSEGKPTKTGVKTLHFNISSRVCTFINHPIFIC